MKLALNITNVTGRYPFYMSELLPLQRSLCFLINFFMFSSLNMSQPYTQLHLLFYCSRLAPVTIHRTCCMLKPNTPFTPQINKQSWLASYFVFLYLALVAFFLFPGSAHGVHLNVAILAEHSRTHPNNVVFDHLGNFNNKYMLTLINEKVQFT